MHNASWLSEKRKQDSPNNKSILKNRSEFDRDLGRVLHSSSFRRLQGKTQVWGVSESDYFRTRLTHSIEAAQIGKALAAEFNLSSTLVMTCCLIHDIGHPPFGHDGAEILKEFALDVSDNKVTFDDNAQNLRIVTSLENTGYSSGLNLTAAALDGIIKYKVKATPSTKKAGYYAEEEKLFDWITKETGTHGKRSPIVMLVELADDVAYATHDLEDGIRSGFIGFNEISAELETYKDQTSSPEYKILEQLRSELQKGCNGDPSDYEKLRISAKKTHSYFIDSFVSRVVENKEVIASKFQSLEFSEGSEVNLCFDECGSLKKEIKTLKNIVTKYVIGNPNIQSKRFACRTLLTEYLNRYRNLITDDILKDSCADFLSLPKSVQKKLKDSSNSHHRLRVILDYVAGMTDTYFLQQAMMFHSPASFGVSHARK